jgi:hypothetical protein
MKNTHRSNPFPHQTIQKNDTKMFTENRSEHEPCDPAERIGEATRGKNSLGGESSIPHEVEIGRAEKLRRIPEAEIREFG